MVLSSTEHISGLAPKSQVRTHHAPHTGPMVCRASTWLCWDSPVGKAAPYAQRFQMTMDGWEPRSGWTDLKSSPGFFCISPIFREVVSENSSCAGKTVLQDGGCRYRKSVPQPAATTRSMIASIKGCRYVINHENSRGQKDTKRVFKQAKLRHYSNYSRKCDKMPQNVPKCSLRNCKAPRIKYAKLSACKNNPPK